MSIQQCSKSTQWPILVMATVNVIALLASLLSLSLGRQVRQYNPLMQSEQPNRQLQSEPNPPYSRLTIFLLATLLFNILVMDSPRRAITTFPFTQLPFPFLQLLFLYFLTLGLVVSRIKIIAYINVLTLACYACAMSLFGFDLVVNGYEDWNYFWVRFGLVMVEQCCVYCAIGFLMLEEITKLASKETVIKDTRTLTFSILSITTLITLILYYFWFSKAAISTQPTPSIITIDEKKYEVFEHFWKSLRHFNHETNSECNENWLYKGYWIGLACFAGFTLATQYYKLLKQFDQQDTVVEVNQNSNQINRKTKFEKKWKYLMISLGLLLVFCRWGSENLFLN